MWFEKLDYLNSCIATHTHSKSYKQGQAHYIHAQTRLFFSGSMNFFIFVFPEPGTENLSFKKVRKLG